MFKPRHDEIHQFLEWRRQTRFIRHYGGPIMAVGLFVTGLWFVWQAAANRHPRPLPQTQMEGAGSAGRTPKERQAEARQRELEARMQRTGVPKPQAIQESTLQASRFGGQ